jgi:2-dehydro-3-deoxyphosphogluconate aldolase / (4S)-4-hydroxy-2-oxoglutarate aldolase
MVMEANVEGVMNALECTRIIAILRGDLKGRSLDVIRILLEEGIRVIEVTMNTPGILETISAAKKEFSERVVLGAGTVRHVAEVIAAKSAGSQFIVSPNTNPDVIRATGDAGMASFPGAFTCSEVMKAFEMGANAVKLFPMVDSSPKFVRALRAPLGNVKLIPTGGITSANAADYLRAGAWGLGVGTELMGAGATSDADLEQLRSNARDFAKATESFRGKPITSHV